jgi:cell division septum initiation protein DivIVA
MKEDIEGHAKEISDLEKQIAELKTKKKGCCG